VAHHIETEVLTKFYGRQRGVEYLTLGVGPGEVFGFLGPNGAGKTTTIRLLMDLIRPTRGTIRVLGYDLRRDPVAARRRTGYLPGNLQLYRDMSGRELLAFFASLRPGADLHMRSGSPGAWIWIWIAMCTTCPRATSRSSASCRPSCTGPIS
jgi:ABC-type multidrug transport system ATPase subunit